MAAWRNPFLDVLKTPRRKKLPDTLESILSRPEELLLLSEVAAALKRAGARHSRIYRSAPIKVQEVVARVCEKHQGDANVDATQIAEMHRAMAAGEWEVALPDHITPQWLLTAAVQRGASREADVQFMAELLALATPQQRAEKLASGVASDVVLAIQEARDLQGALTAALQAQLRMIQFAEASMPLAAFLCNWTIPDVTNSTKAADTTTAIPDGPCPSSGPPTIAAETAQSVPQETAGGANTAASLTPKRATAVKSSSNGGDQTVTIRIQPPSTPSRVDAPPLATHSANNDQSYDQGYSGEPMAGGNNEPMAGGDDKPLAGGDDELMAGGDDEPLAGGDDEPLAGDDDEPLAGGDVIADDDATGRSGDRGEGGDDDEAQLAQRGAELVLALKQFLHKQDTAAKSTLMQTFNYETAAQVSKLAFQLLESDMPLKQVMVAVLGDQWETVPLPGAEHFHTEHLRLRVWSTVLVICKECHRLMNKALAAAKYRKLLSATAYNARKLSNDTIGRVIRGVMKGMKKLGYMPLCDVKTVLHEARQAQAKISARSPAGRIPLPAVAGPSQSAAEAILALMGTPAVDERAGMVSMTLTHNRDLNADRSMDIPAPRAEVFRNIHGVALFFCGSGSVPLFLELESHDSSIDMRDAGRPHIEVMGFEQPADGSGNLSVRRLATPNIAAARPLNGSRYVVKLHFGSKFGAGMMLFIKLRVDVGDHTVEATSPLLRILTKPHTVIATDLRPDHDAAMLQAACDRLEDRSQDIASPSPDAVATITQLSETPRAFEIRFQKTAMCSQFFSKNLMKLRAEGATCYLAPAKPDKIQPPLQLVHQPRVLVKPHPQVETPGASERARRTPPPTPDSQRPRKRQRLDDEADDE